MLKLELSRIGELFSAIDSRMELYLPLFKKGRVDFGRWSQGEKPKLDVLKTVKSAKDLFFPQSEDIAEFQVQQKNISITQAERFDKPFMVFGVRECDAKAFDILDSVFLSDPVDTFYKARRDNGLVVTLACAEPEETCFCTVFGLDAAQPGGDVACWITGGFLYWQPNTLKGEKLTEEISQLFETADETELNETKEAIRAILKRLPLSGLDVSTMNEEALKDVFDSPKWQDLSKACIGCGTCTFVCPTCQCYDIRDYDTGNGIKRYRCWDSCMYSDFTMMAHGNPRKTQLERFRQRFMHKLVYYPENHDGNYMCVGCGRCVSRCPVSMNIVKVIKALGANDDGK
ncbi:MAG: 4Fe-4S dicluster domain-containing protein [Christensenellales bacterium]|jgi:sulfhydrogenase subunit beta (sulfur reductase)